MAEEGGGGQGGAYAGGDVEHAVFVFECEGDFEAFSDDGGDVAVVVVGVDDDAVVAEDVGEDCGHFVDGGDCHRFGSHWLRGMAWPAVTS